VGDNIISTATGIKPTYHVIRKLKASLISVKIKRFEITKKVKSF
jgi:hypothetical protein